MVCDGPRVAELFFEICVRNWMTVREVYRMARLAVLGPDDALDPHEQHKQAMRDRDLLKLPLPREEALAIWERSRDFLLQCAEFSEGERRAKIERFLAERDAVMAKLGRRMQ